MSIDSLKSMIPDHAKDLRLNLGSLASDISLTPQQLAGTFISTAIASRNNTVIRAIEAEFSAQLSPEALSATRSAASIMSMNNIYYRFTHMAGETYSKLPARLRMSVIANPGVEKADFELWSLAVSAINGCEMCVTSHERTVREHGLSSEQVQTAVRIAATVFAVSVTIQEQEALS